VPNRSVKYITGDGLQGIYAEHVTSNQSILDQVNAMFQRNHIGNGHITIHSDMQTEVVAGVEIPNEHDLICVPVMCAKNVLVGYILVLVDCRHSNQDTKNYIETVAVQLGIGYSAHKLINELNAAIKNLEAMVREAHMYRDQAQESEMAAINAYYQTIEGWANLLEVNDRETKGHSIRVTELMDKFAESMGLGDLRAPIRWGSLLHDIGKMAIPETIINKPGRLTEEEMEVVMKHPDIAHRVLSGIQFLAGTAIDIPHCHHEKWDGTGYPQGLRGEQIPLAARMFAIIDVWDALASDRPYQEAMNLQQILTEIKNGINTHFDPYCVKVFLGSVLPYIFNKQSAENTPMYPGAVFEGVDKSGLQEMIQPLIERCNQAISDNQGATEWEQGGA
jgi:putative nucleotidyltransferase with HDIG domain